MRIALVSPGYPPTLGGVETVVAQAARALARGGARVDVLAQERRRDLPWIVDDDGVIVHRFPATRSNAYPIAPGLWQHLRRHRDRYDIVHGHNYHCVAAAGAALSACARRGGPGFVFSPHYHGGGHTAVSSLMHRFYRPLGRAAFARAGAVVCVSETEAGLVAAHFPEAAARIAIVRNAVDSRAIAAAEPWPDQPPTVLSVGRLERSKRVDRLLAAFRLVPEPAQLLVIGAGSERGRLEGLAADLNLRGRVRFLGRIDDADLARWLCTAQVLCSLSEHEAFGLAPAEALAAGAAVVLSDIPAHAELLPRAAGRLIGPGQDEAGIAAVLAAALAAGRRQPAAPVGGWDEVAATLRALYENLLARGGGAT